MKKFWQDFKKFITRGNVIDMAVGVAVATAFTAIVTAFTKGFISPIIALLTGDSSLDTMTYVLRPEVYDEAGEVVTPAVELLWGTFLQKIIDFLIIAIVLFVVLRIATAIAARSAKIRQNMINKFTDADEKAAEAAAAAAAAEAEAKAKAEEEAKAKAEAEAEKVRTEEERRRSEIALLTEIRDLLKNK
jgi:large conductance mechanosensitive channel